MVHAGDHGFLPTRAIDDAAFDGVEVAGAFADGGVGVAGGDRRGDGGVVAADASTMRRTSARLRVEREQAVELVGVEEPGQHLAVDLDEQRVAARPGDGGVEAAIETAELGETDARSELLSDLGDLGAGIVVGALGGEADDRQLERAPGLEELADEALGIVVEGGDGDVGEALGDERAVAPALDDAERHEPLDRLAHRRAGDAELFGQRPLRRDPRARLQLAGGDALQELLADPAAERLAPDRLEHHRRLGGGHRGDGIGRRLVRWSCGLMV